MKILPNNIAVLENDTHASKWVSEQGTLAYDNFFNERVYLLLKPDDYVVDAGAYIGDTTHGFLHAVGPGGRVYAFEPNPEAFACLKHNCPAAVAFDCALGDRVGIVSFFLLEKGNIGASRLSKSEPSEWKAIVIKLDSLELKKLDFFKLDVEGYEPYALAGAEDTICRLRPLILTEINHKQLAVHGFTAQDIIKKCELWNYRLEFLEPHHSLALPQVDVLFRPK